jgi:hypothetical protein
VRTVTAAFGGTFAGLVKNRIQAYSLLSLLSLKGNVTSLATLFRGWLENVLKWMKPVIGRLAQMLVAQVKFELNENVPIKQEIGRNEVKEREKRRFFPYSSLYISEIV